MNCPSNLGEGRVGRGVPKRPSPDPLPEGEGQYGPIKSKRFAAQPAAVTATSPAPLGLPVGAAPASTLARDV